LTNSREQAQQLIKSSSVQLNGEIVTKSSLKVKDDDEIILLNQIKYVSRGGLKLEFALKEFGINVKGLTALDVGSSTGGFTDCLLQHCVSKIYCVDVGHNQIAQKIKEDSRVEIFEDTDIRKLDKLPELVDLIVIDVSFISLQLVLPVVIKFLKPSEKIIALIKPQYESGSRKINKTGIIKNESIRQKIVDDLVKWIKEQGWKIINFVRSPIEGGDGNVEYFVCLCC
jgi:23S rRNA (cytidine1920-2'-O)/16S rRNA (cytidine1409-2'-O)-methyltransferase